MRTVAFMTLGCKVNQYETETMEGLFRQAGYRVVPFTESADVYIVNTCSVTMLGEKKSRQLVRRAQRQNEAALIAVTGCYAQLAPDVVGTLPGVRLIVGTQDRGRIVELVEEAAVRPDVLRDVGDIMAADTFEDIPLFAAPERTRAFLKIQEGCQNFCTFCIIPYTRGPLRSRALASVRREAEKLVAAGFREIVLTGIHLGAYGRDLTGTVTLADAARTVLEIDGLQRLRLGSLESVELTPALFTLLRDDRRFARHLHLPLQAGSDAVLQEMHRFYDTAGYERLLARIREEVPGIAISTDIIVGFPGETEAMFQESLAFVRRQEFARVHVFPYSRRPATPAAARSDQVPHPVRRERVKMMQALADEMATDYHGKFIGTIVPVLFETQHEGVADGLTDTYIRVYTKGPVKVGEITAMRLLRLYQDGLWGEPI
ncbi:MAG: tRNA (N(6)-L-threonylcarbamoyladenosine(37)-C(2))-methylthiotransferase MtaB [Negativicutes bacterium]